MFHECFLSALTSSAVCLHSISGAEISERRQSKITFLLEFALAREMLYSGYATDQHRHHARSKKYSDG
jgi:hypothetical protein